MTHRNKPRRSGSQPPFGGNREPSEAELERAWKQYGDDFRTRTLPMMTDSRIFLAIGTASNKFDVKMATEIGAALMLDKPMILLIPTGTVVPERLRRIADVVVDDWDNSPAAKHRLSLALAELTDEPVPHPERN